MKIGQTVVEVSWEDNEAVESLRELCKDNPFTVQLSMYGDSEQVGSLGTALPANDEQMTTSAGDIVLYAGDQLVIFYGSNSWSYTRIGKLDGMSAEDVRRFVNAGGGNVMITLSLQPIHTGLDEFSDDKHGDCPAYTITGQIAPKGYRGIVIQNGKKILK